MDWCVPRPGSPNWGSRPLLACQPRPRCARCTYLVANCLQCGEGFCIPFFAYNSLPALSWGGSMPTAMLAQFSMSCRLRTRVAAVGTAAVVVHPSSTPTPAMSWDLVGQ